MVLSLFGQSRDAERRRPAADPGLGTWVTNATSDALNSKIHTITHTLMAAAIGSVWRLPFSFTAADTNSTRTRARKEP